MSAAQVEALNRLFRNGAGERKMSGLELTGLIRDKWGGRSFEARIAKRGSRVYLHVRMQPRHRAARCARSLQMQMPLCDELEANAALLSRAPQITPCRPHTHMHILKHRHAHTKHTHKHQIMWKFLEQQSFHMTREEYDAQMAAVADVVSEWGAADM